MSIGPIAPLSEAAAEIAAAARVALDQALSGLIEPAQVSSPPAPPRAPGATQAPEPIQAPPAAADPAPARPTPEQAALASMTSSAAAEQDSLAPLLADLAVTADAPELPPQVRALAAQILAAQPPLTEAASGETLRVAAQRSGLFLEAAIAATIATPGGAPPDLTQDMKALVLKMLGSLDALSTAAPPSPAGAPPQGAATQTAAPADSPAAALEAAVARARSTPPPAAPRGSEAELPADPVPTVEAAPSASAAPTTSAPVARSTADRPAPPLSGGAPRGQPPAAPSAEAAAGGARLLATLRRDARAALARIELAQAASLPKPGEAVRHWTLEAPVATPAGPAIAQLAISREDAGHGSAGGAPASPTWRARFALDLEPSGPISAEVSLAAGVTRVTLWAERAEALAALQAHQPDLLAALAGAGEVQVRLVAGAPATAGAEPGQLLDQRS